MTKLLITGAVLRPDAYELGDGKYYQKAVLAEIELKTGKISTILEKKSAGKHYPTEHPNLQFTAGCIENNVLWLPTDTEVLKYRLPDFKYLDTISHPSFQNIHSVAVIDGKLVVTSTGLDNVIIINPESGEVEKSLNTEGKDPWHRFDSKTDYRLVHTTKPHDSHPNFTFKLGNDIWVTRCTQEDAVNLSDVSQRIKVTNDEVISIHDGIVNKENVFFTRVDGYIVKCSATNKKWVENIDIFANDQDLRVKGWCRGLCIDNDIFYVGFSKLRKTRLKQKLKFLAKGQFNQTKHQEAAVVAYNMKTRRVQNVFIQKNMPLDCIYTILKIEN